VSVRIVRLGAPRAEGEGLRIGTVRRPPRGVKKEDFSRQDWFDVWYPELSPSQALVSEALKAESDKDWAKFVRAFKGEMAEAAPRRTIELLAALSQSADFSVGCYCEDEARCHRSVLRELLTEAGAKITA
jgi:uncharacterized protein YeaO (DUF488 family)